MNVTDPVCRKDMDLGDASAFEDHEGWAYFFCSPDCHMAFKRSPDRFTEHLSKDSGNRAGPSAAHHRTAS